MESPTHKIDIVPNPKRQTRDTNAENVRPVETSERPRQTMGQIRQSLFDPHVISEKHDRGGRKAVASEITGGRQLSRSISGNIAGREEILRQIEQQQSSTLNALKAETLLALEQGTEHMLARLKSMLVGGSKTADEIGGAVGSLSTEIDSLSKQAEEVRTELAQIREGQAFVPDSKKLLEAYYEKMETVALTNEEKREFLKPEVLAELSTEEYIALWRRLNPHFLSHVTRQGFRDHNAMMMHSGGLQEFHNGLVGVLEDEKTLRPPMAVGPDGLRARDETSVKVFLENWALKAENEEEAKKRLGAQLNFTWATAPRYPDKTAVHFAAQIVADGYYGGESGNEVFFLYPSDVLASQHNYAFNGSGKDFTEPQNEIKWNDVFIWPSSLDNPGISVDASLVFLPENTPVDPETGSKYASEIKTVEGEEKRVMIEDKTLVPAFIEWARNLTSNSPAVQSYKVAYRENRDPWKEPELKRICFDMLRQEMVKLGFDSETAAKLTDTILSNDGMGAFIASGKLDWGNATPEEAARGKLESASANWERAKNTVSSKEYWEKYFAKNPQQKPKHIVFYNGDPTSAIYEFQQKNNIGQADVSKTEGKLLGFDDRHIADMGKDPRVNVGYDELVKTAHRIIADHYKS